MTKTAPSALPETYREFAERFQRITEAHEAIAKVVDQSGPLDRKTCELVKLGLSIGAGLETATRSHTRRALEAGASQAEVEQAILLAVNTCGFPRTVAAWRWARNDMEPS